MLTDPNHAFWAVLALAGGFVLLTMVLFLAWLCAQLWLYWLGELAELLRFWRTWLHCRLHGGHQAGPYDILCTRCLTRVSKG